ncbi:MAG: SH3 domain-containing protein [Chloroflexota bacterium]
MKLLIDVSYYNNLSPAQWDLLAPILDGVIIRLSYGLSQDQMAQTHIDTVKRLGLPYAGYHWVDPTRDLYSQINFYKFIVERFKPASMFNDFEQYWTDWAAYMRQDLATAYATRFTAAQLNSYYSKFYEESRKLVNIPVGSYSADWFISKYAPDMGNWVTKTNYWEARYFRYYDSTWWMAKKKELGKDFDINKILEIAKQAKIIKGIGRQFESYIEVDGLSENIGYHLDWNVFSNQGFYRMFGVDPEPKPIPPESEVYVVVSQKVGNQALRLRAKPNTKSGVLAGEIAGTKLKVLGYKKLAIPKVGVMGRWLKVLDPEGREGYVASGFVELIPSEPPPPTPPPPPEELIVAVSEEVGTLGLRLRAQPNTTSATLAGEAMGTNLKVLEDIDVAKSKIGIYDQWLNVSDPNDLVGYVAAWYVVEVEQEEPKLIVEELSEIIERPGMIEKNYKVIDPALWVRDKPDGSKTGYLWKDEIITVTEVADKWAYFGKGWVNMTYLVAV